MAPIIINNGLVEVQSINSSKKRLDFILHFKGTKKELMEFPANAYCQHNVHYACKYLQAEGFVPKEMEDWNIHTGVIAHP